MNELLHYVAEVLYLFAPLLLSAALSGLVMRQNWLPWLRRPIDAGAKWRGKQLFGNSKTWRGVVVAIVGCMIGAAIQRYVIGARAHAVARFDYTELNVLAFGLAMGAPAMAGELPNSFVKRRLDIAPGKTTRGWLSVLFYVWDQIDLLTLTWPALFFWVDPDFNLIVTSVGVTLLLHPLSSLLGYVVGARRSAR
ncbi:MAG: CDP-archaeol synthase [Polyangiales bacterium]